MDKPFVPFPDVITSYCKNCGRKSHCSESLIGREYNWKKKFLGEKEICKKCRCIECTGDNKDGTL